MCNEIKNIIIETIQLDQTQYQPSLTVKVKMRYKDKLKIIHNLNNNSGCSFKLLLCLRSVSCSSAWDGLHVLLIWSKEQGCLW